MAELVDALVLGTSIHDVKVRVLSSALNNQNMKVGQQVDFFLFGIRESGTIIKKHKGKLYDIQVATGLIYPQCQVFRTLPRKKAQIPPWYMLA